MYAGTSVISFKVCKHVKFNFQIEIIVDNISGALYGTMAPFMLGPLVPIFCRLMPAGFLPENSSIVLEKPVLFHVEYFYDLDKYYYPLVIHSYFGTTAYMTVAVAIDSMFMVYVQHACAIFAIIGYY